MVVCPPFTDLRTLQTLIEADKLKIRLGAQNCHWEDQGAFTGEVSPPMLAKLTCSYVIIGHSERRQLFGETDETVNQKLKAVQKHGMTPIVCVGETLEEREAGATAERGHDQTERRVRGREGGRRGQRASSPTSRSGPSAPAATRRPRTPTRPSASSAARCATLYGDDTADADPHPVRREREVGQHGRAHGDARDRRRARRRRVARSRRVRPDRPVP